MCCPVKNKNLKEWMKAVPYNLKTRIYAIEILWSCDVNEPCLGSGTPFTTVFIQCSTRKCKGIFQHASSIHVGLVQKICNRMADTKISILKHCKATKHKIGIWSCISTGCGSVWFRSHAGEGVLELNTMLGLYLLVKLLVESYLFRKVLIMLRFQNRIWK